MMLFSVLQRRGLIVANQLQRYVVSLQTRSFDSDVQSANSKCFIVIVTGCIVVCLLGVTLWKM